MGVHLGVCGFIPSHFRKCKCDFWVTFLACTFPCFCLNHEPNAKVVTSINCFIIAGSNEVFTFICCTFSLMHILTLANYSSSIVVQPIMVKFCMHSQVGVSSMIISPTFGWKKVSSKCYLTISCGIIRLITKTNIDSMGCFGTCSIILKSGMQSNLETNLM